MDYEKVKEVIAKQIKENGRGEITGSVLQSVLLAMVDSLGEVYPQTYTEEQKAQARANIDALSNHNGAITEEKLSTEVQAILDDVANKQNITDESLATIAKTIVGAINEVYNGGLKDASIATSKIEDGAITEPKLDTTLQAKVSNNVKTVEQTLTDEEIAIASKNLKFRDDNGNFFADKASYDAVAKLDASEKPNYSIFGNKCINNTFGHSCENYTFGNNCQSNTFGDGCKNYTFGNECHNNTFGDTCLYFTIGNCCYGNTFGDNLTNFQIDTGVSFIIVNSNSNYSRRLKNVHILSGVSGKSFKKLTINIPDEYLNSSRELIITTKVTSGNRPLTPEDIVMYYADEVVDKQNKQDNTLATTSKEVVGAINELFNGGVKNKSIVSDKIADYSITMSKLNRAGSYVPDLGLSAMHNLDITLTGEGKTGSATLQSNGVTYDQIDNIVYAIDSIIRQLGNGVTLIITEPVAGSSFGTEYVGTVTGVTNRSSTELSAIVKNLTDNKDYFVVVNLVNYEFITKISLTDQLPKITSLDSKVGMNVKVLGRAFNKDWVNLDEITDVGFYLLPDGKNYLGEYTNLPLAMRDGDIKFMWVDKYSTIPVRQKILTMASGGALNNSIHFGWVYRSMLSTGVWSSWGYVDFSQQILDALSSKLDNTSTLTDTEVNNIWDNN